MSKVSKMLQCDHCKHIFPYQVFASACPNCRREKLNLVSEDDLPPEKPAEKIPLITEIEKYRVHDPKKSKPVEFIAEDDKARIRTRKNESVELITDTISQGKIQKIKKERIELIVSPESLPKDVRISREKVELLAVTSRVLPPKKKVGATHNSEDLSYAPEPVSKKPRSTVPDVTEEEELMENTTTKSAEPSTEDHQDLESSGKIIAISQHMSESDTAEDMALEDEQDTAVNEENDGLKGESSSYQQIEADFVDTPKDSDGEIRRKRRRERDSDDNSVDSDGENQRKRRRERDSDDDTEDPDRESRRRRRRERDSDDDTDDSDRESRRRRRKERNAKDDTVDSDGEGPKKTDKERHDQEETEDSDRERRRRPRRERGTETSQEETSEETRSSRRRNREDEDAEARAERRRKRRERESEEGESSSERRSRRRKERLGESDDGDESSSVEDASTSEEEPQNTVSRFARKERLLAATTMSTEPEETQKGRFGKKAKKSSDPVPNTDDPVGELESEGGKSRGFKKKVKADEDATPTYLPRERPRFFVDEDEEEPENQDKE